MAVIRALVFSSCRRIPGGTFRLAFPVLWSGNSFQRVFDRIKVAFELFGKLPNQLVECILKAP